MRSALPQPVLIGWHEAEGALKRQMCPGWGLEPVLLKAGCPPPAGTMQLSLALCLVCLLVHAAFCVVEGQGWQAFKNDATEIIPELSEYPEPLPELENNKTMNRAENGGRPPHHPFETKGIGVEESVFITRLQGGFRSGGLEDWGRLSAAARDRGRTACLCSLGIWVQGHEAGRGLQ